MGGEKGREGGWKRGQGGKKQLPHQKNLISHSDTHENRKGGGGGGGAADAGVGGGGGMDACVRKQDFISSLSNTPL